MCKFKAEHCRPHTGQGEYCSFYNLEFTQPALSQRVKEIYKQLETIDRTLGELKKTDKAEYNYARQRMRDLFYGGIMVSKALAYLKRSGGQTLAEKLIQKKDKARP